MKSVAPSFLGMRNVDGSRVAEVMQALANVPPLILADETTAYLDAKTGRVIGATHVSAVAGAAANVTKMEASQIIREHTLKGARLAS